MTPKILVVDDEPDLELLIRQKFRKQIRENAYEFVFAHNGTDALNILRQDLEIDILLTDINMPKMDGLTLLARLAENHVNPLLKPIIVSAYSDMENIRIAMNRGAFDFITKPIDFSDLEITLQKTTALIEILKEAQRNEVSLGAINQELNVARNIQQAILPQTFPPYPERTDFDVHAHMITAKAVGGDFYDFFLIDEHRLGFLIADVSDKGVPAAIFMAVSRTLLKSTALRGLEPAACLKEANNILTHESDTGMFVTVFYGILDLRTGQIQYSNGGHNPPFFIKNDGTIATLPPTGDLLLGIMDSADYKQEEMNLHPGDYLFLYTDGIPEAMNAKQEMYSEERLEHLLRRLDRSTPRALVGGIISEITHFANGVPQSDDITCLAIRYNGAP